MGRYLPHVQLLAAALLFSTGGMAVKSCGLADVQIASWRCGIAAVTLLLCLPLLQRSKGEALREGQGSAPRPRAGLTWLHGFVGLSYAVTLVGFVLANKATTAANAIFLQSTAPIYIFFLAPWLLKERLRRSDLVVMLSLAVGMGLLLSGEVTATSVAPAPMRGNLLGAMCGLTWAVTLLGLRHLSVRGGDSDNSGDALRAVILGNVLGCLLVLPWALPMPAAPLVDWLWLVYLGVFQIGLAYLLLTWGLRRLSAFEAAILLLAEPLFNPLWAYMVHGEIPRGLALAGALIIFLVTVVRPFLERRPTEAPSHG